MNNVIECTKSTKLILKKILLKFVYMANCFVMAGLFPTVRHIRKSIKILSK